MIGKKSIDLRGKKICWVSFLILDMALHRTSQIEILRSLAKRGHETSLFAVYSKERPQSNMKDVHLITIPLRYIPCLSSLMYTIFLFVYLPFQFMHSKPDFVIVEPRDPTFLSVLPTVLLPKSKRPKIIMDVRTTPVVTGYIKTLLFKTAIRITKKLFDGMTIITPMMRNEICDEFHIDPKTVGVWTSGVSTAMFNPENYDRVALRKKHGLHNKFVIFHHGAIGQSVAQGRARGIFASIKSIEILKNECPDLVLFLLGDSRSYHWIKELIEECGVQDKVILHDKVNYEDVPQYIALCDCALVPLPDLSLWRNQSPLKLLEYLAMEKVFIATGIPANRYIIGESKCAVYIPSASPEEIAKAILYIHGNRQKLKEWGVFGRKIVEEKYTWEKVARDFEDYLLSLNPHMN